MIIRNSNLPTDFSAVYFCPVCWCNYPSKEAAMACATTNEKLVYKAGDIIIIDIAYGWYDGDERWIIKNTGKFHDLDTCSAYFVVTEIENDERHNARYHVKTLGIKNGNPTGLCGYTATSHKLGKIVDNPEPWMVEQAKPFIGGKYDHLL